MGGVVYRNNLSHVLRAVTRWMDNLQRDDYLEKNVRRLYEKELARAVAELTAKYEAASSAQTLLMHHNLQSTHAAALSLEQQLAGSERAGRVYMLQNLFVRQYYNPNPNPNPNPN